MRKRVICTILCIIILLGSFAGCVPTANKSNNPVKFTSLQDIPGITKEDIQKIKNLVEQKKSSGKPYFSYAMMVSTEAFLDSDNNINGYSLYVCEWLAEIFGIEFKPEHHPWQDILKGLETGEIDFTGTMTRTPERLDTYFMTDAIAQRSIKYFRLTNSVPISEIRETRLPRFALLENSSSAKDVLLYAMEEFEPVFVPEYITAYEMLKSGEIDALLAESHAEAIFDEFGEIITSPFLPLIYSPVSLTTQNSELKIIIDTVQKALENNSMSYLNQKYEQGHRQYQRNKLFSQFTQEELDYIKNNPVVYFGAEYDNYPASFYNSRYNEWQGICFDVLDEVTILTGIEFKVANETNVEFHALRNMLENGDIPFISELIRSPEREGDYLWLDHSFMSDTSVLISRIDHRNIPMAEVYSTRVGLSRNTAHTEFFQKLFPNHQNSVIYDGQEFALQALANGEIDMVMSNYSTLLHLTNYMELPDYKANIIFNNNFESGFGFNKDEEILCSIFNKSMALIDTDIISSQWMHRTYDYLLSMAQAQRPWLIGMVILSVFILILVIAFLLRSHRTGKNLEVLVNKRTNELALQTATLTAVFDTIPNHIFTKDLNSIYMDCNRSLVEHFGLEKENIIGKDDVGGLGIPADLAQRFVEEDNKAIKEGKTVITEEIVPHINGALPLYEIIKIPLIVNDETVGIIGVSHDITERVEKERQSKAIYEYAKKLSRALARITQSPTISDGDLKNAANVITKEGCRALNADNIGVWLMSDNQTELENLSYYNHTNKEHTVLGNFDLECRPEYVELLKTERLIIMNNSTDCELITGGENSCLCAALDAPIYVEGKLVGVVCVEQNDCKEYPGRREWLIEEQNFASSLADLMALAISGFERHKARDEAEIANKTKSVFLANMSHEIRTPMNAILGVTEILMQSETLPETIEDGLDRIYNSCDMLLGIINDILDFSKIEAGKLDIITAKYSIASLINDSVQLNLMRLDDSKSISFEVEVDENTPAKLIGDELRIKQILNNLLSNAFKYTDSGKVSLKVSCEPTEAVEYISLVITVSDTGIGMTEEQLERLFNEYTRFNTESGNKAEGTGLGLAITQRLVKLINGVITVESEPGKGSSFTIKLLQEPVTNEPIGKEVADNLRLFRTNDASNRKKRRMVREPMPYGSVLVVDDVETNLYVATGLMRPYKLKIDVASCGREAIDLVKSGLTYDVIFMDHMMPEMDGIETTKLLREFGYTAPIVALTANAVAGQADMFLKNGFDEFLSKPVDTRQLNTILNKLIRDKQSPEVIKAARLQKNNTNDQEKAEKPQTDIIMLESFIRDARKTVTLLEGLSDLNKEEALQEFIISVHGIKSSLWNIGERELSEAARQLESGGREKNTEFIKSASPDFLTKLRTLLEKLEKTESSGSKETDPEIQLEKLRNVIELCSDYNRKGALDILTSMGNSPVLSRIKEYVLHSDFEEAERLAKGVERYDGDEETYLKVMRSYTKSIGAVVSEINAEDISDYEIKVHGIKGASRDIFAEQIAKPAEELEKAAKLGDTDYINKNNTAFLETVNQFISELNNMLTAIDIANPKPKKDKPDTETLSKLLTACNSFDIDTAEQAMAEIEKYTYSSDDELAPWLRENFDLLKFGEIAEKLSEMLKIT